MTRSNGEAALRGTVELLAGSCVIAMLTVVMVQVLGRLIADEPPIWTEEIARVLLVLMTCIGAVAVSLHGGHIAMDLFAAESRLRAFLGRVSAILTAATGAILAVVALRYALSMTGTHLPVTSLPAYLLQGAVAVMGAAVALAEISRALPQGRASRSWPADRTEG